MLTDEQIQYIIKDMCYVKCGNLYQWSILCAHFKFNKYKFASYILKTELAKLFPDRYWLEGMCKRCERMDKIEMKMHQKYLPDEKYVSMYDKADMSILTKHIRPWWSSVQCHSLFTSLNCIVPLYAI